MVITDLEAVDSEFSDPVLSALIELQNDLTDEIDAIKTSLEEGAEAHKKEQKDLTAEFTAVKEQIAALHKLVNSHFNKKEGEEGESSDEYWVKKKNSKRTYFD